MASTRTILLALLTAACITAAAAAEDLPAPAVLRLGDTRFKAGSVSELKFVAQGRELLIARDDDVIVMDAESGLILRTLENPRAEMLWLTAMIVSADQKLAFVGMCHGEVRILDVETGKLKSVIALQKSMINALAVSRDGTLLAAAIDKHVVLWDLKKDCAIRTHDHGADVIGVAFTPDGKTLSAMSCGEDRMLRHYDLASGRMTSAVEASSAVEGSEYCIESSLEYPGSGQWLLSTDMGAREIVLWPAKDNRAVKRFSGHKGQPLCAFMTPDEKTIVSGSAEAIRVWDVESGRERAQLECRTNPQMALSPDGKRLAWVKENTICIHDLATMAQVNAALAGHLGSVIVLGATPDGKNIITASSDGTVRWWDAATETMGRVLFEKGPRFQSFALSPDQKVLAGIEEEKISLFKLGEEKPYTTFEGRSVRFSPDSTRIAVADANHVSGKLCVYNVETGKRVAGLEPEERQELESTCARVSEMHFTPDGTKLITSGDGMHVWDIARGKRHEFLKEQFPWRDDFALSPDGLTLVARNPNDLHFIDVLSGETFAHVKGPASAVAVSGFGLVAAGEDATVVLYDAWNGGKRASYSGHSATVLSLDFSRDGRRLFSGSEDTTVLVWKLPEPPRAHHAAGGDEFAAAWAALAEPSAAAARKAMASLSLAGDAAAAYLQRKLAENVPDAANVGALIEQLDSDDFAIRQKATAELAGIDGAEEPIQAALKRPLSAEVKSRLSKILEVQERSLGAPPETSRALRAVSVLEQIATPAAIEALKSVAAERGESRVGIAARLALVRLGERD